MRLFAVLLPLVAACSPAPAPQAAAAWPEADALFRNDPSWIGADGAYSIDLGSGRVLWTFGDSFIATSAKRTRSESVLVRNSVAIQQGYDPSQATIHFYWNTVAGKPASYFPEAGTDWFWPGHGARLGNVLLLFYARQATAMGGLGFAAAGYTAVLVDNPDAEPSAWHLNPLAVPANPFGATVGFGGVYVEDSYLYSYSPTDAGGHMVYLLRWPVSAVQGGDLSAPEWWTGSGFVAQAMLSGTPQAVFSGQTEFTVERSGPGRYLEVQVDGFGATNIVLRSAGLVTGPWSDPQVAYRPPESDRSNVLVYSAKGHPELLGAPVVVTYCSNDFDFATLVGDMSLYYPRFVRLTPAQ